MALYTVDVYSNSSDAIIRDSHADGVIVKATQGTGYVNPRCNHQWDLAGSLGKLRGLYHYAGGGNPVSEAQYFISNIKNYVGQGILILDWESYQNASWGNSNWARQFVDEVHRLTGVWCVIYVQESALWQVANCANTCGVWVAKYASMNWNSWTLPNMGVSAGAFGALTGWQFTGGDMDRSIFYISKEGWQALANPGRNGWQGNGNTWHYFENGTEVKGDWRKVDGKWYYMDANGNTVSGWQKINNRWYSFNVNHDGAFGAALTGWQCINDRWYYMDPENAWCVTGWNKINGKWYYMDPTNAWCLTGLQTIGGKQYYLDPTNAWMVTGKQTINGVEYTTDDSGALHTVAKPQPTQPTIPDQPTEPAKPTVTLSDADRQAIVDDLKPYIKEVVKQEIANVGR
ncbi:GH25 family lysozyme [Limosilactobacillus kribbianus]|uniref:GH25 family lysozyme n=1 Tax=Limosilactobacillus kribbianus TaxID=2982695 RepID=UPI002263F112|nr:GH25 family lysozyme [Limosilactobacillus kribbianus]